MPKFMNAELIQIRDSLTCNHCAATFQGSDSQAWKVKYENRVVYCSSACRNAVASNRRSTPAPNRGPCKNCKKEFFSRTAKLYCSMTCYVTSDQFKKHQAMMSEKASAPEARQKIVDALKKGEMAACLECGDEVYQQRHRKRKFCSTSCYRAYLAKRFDRWVANPEGMALPQCYDEFLDRDILPCVVAGCEWRGSHLTLHVNQAHGIKQSEFKRATGFNLSTGVIARPLAHLLQQRPLQGIANTPANRALPSAKECSEPKVTRYKSAEAREHQKKGMAIAGPGPERTCLGCGLIYQQSTPFGRSLYCTPECRDNTHAKKRALAAKVRERDATGKFVWRERGAE